MHRDEEITRDLQRTAFLAQAIDLAAAELLQELALPPDVRARVDERRLRAVLHRHLAIAWDDAERRSIDLRQQVILLSERLSRTKHSLADALRRISDQR